MAKDRNLNRRDFLHGTALASGALLGASAAGMAAKSASAMGVRKAPAVLQSTKTITFWHSFTQAVRTDQMRKIADAFEAANPGLRVIIEVVPWPEFPRKWPTAQAANALPDLAVLTPEHAVSMLNADAIYPTDDIINGLGGPEAFKPGILEKTSIYNGTNVAVPFYAHSRLLIQRTDWLEEAGLQAPTTWEDVVTAAAALTSPPERYGMILQVATDDYGGVLVLQQILRAMESHFFDAEGNVTFDSPEGRRGVEIMKQIYDEAMPPGAVNYRVADAFNLVATGKSAMASETAFVMSVALEKNPSLTETLQGTGAARIEVEGWVSEPICMTTPQGENHAEAVELAKFLFQEDNYVPFLHTIPAGQYPTLTAVADSDAFWDHPMFELLEREAELTLEGMEVGSQVGFDFGPNPYAAVLKTGIIEAMLQDVFLNNTPIEQAVKNTSAEMQSQIDEIKSRM